jgi:hypothetical protein
MLGATGTERWAMVPQHRLAPVDVANMSWGPRPSRRKIPYLCYRPCRRSSVLGL